MSSFYRRPGVDTPSSDGSPVRNNNARHSRARSENPPTGIGDGQGGQLVPSRPTSPPQSSHTTADGTNIRDLLLHSLLEDKFLRESARELGKDRSHPEVQQHARAAYESFYNGMPGVSDSDHRIAGDGMRRSRLAISEGLGFFARRQINQLLPRSSGQTTSSSSDLEDSDIDERARPSLAIPMPENTALSQQHPLQGSPGVHIDQYLRDFTELGKVGKGGYGKVLKVRHKLDNSVYAVKRIVVSKLIIEKIHRDGLVAMNSLLEEVRALARLDHKNIVRYFYAWFDYASASASTSMDMSTSSLSGPSNLLEDASSRSCDDETNPEDLPFDELSFNNSNDDMVPDIIFGYSDSGPGPEHSEAEESQDYLGPIVSPRKAITGRKRSATVETIFSTSSNEGTVRPAGDDEEADETIPRSDLQLTQGPAPARRREYVTESTVAAPLLSAPLSTTVLTLNVQMSLYDTNLAIYLNPSLHSDNIAPDSNQLTHCFHPLTSLLLLTEILDGVEYLHSQGIVHRDLKPANIFLSISAAKIPPAGSVNVRACSECPNSSGGAGACYINPRIGDLGLVAALDDNPGSEATTGCPSTTAAAAPVGTEFYRPLTPCNDLAKLDIFSLGVVAVELLRNFDTKMERFETLTALKAGKLPEDFGKGLGRFGAEIEGLVRGMVEGEEEVRFACEEVKRRLAEIVSDMQCL